MEGKNSNEVEAKGVKADHYERYYYVKIKNKKIIFYSL
jgi:hypothetical protein